MHISGRIRTFTSADTIEHEIENALRYSLQMLNTLTHGSALPDHPVGVKKVYIFMAVRTLDPKHCHIDSTWYVVEDMTNNIFSLRIATGTHKGTRLTLLRVNCPADDSFPVPASIIFGFRFVCDLQEPLTKGKDSHSESSSESTFVRRLFSHGQFCVTLSRATHPSIIVLLSERGAKKPRT